MRVPVVDNQILDHFSLLVKSIIKGQRSSQTQVKSPIASVWFTKKAPPKSRKPTKTRIQLFQFRKRLFKGSFILFSFYTFPCPIRVPVVDNRNQRITKTEKKSDFASFRPASWMRKGRRVLTIDGKVSLDGFILKYSQLRESAGPIEIGLS